MPARSAAVPNRLLVDSQAHGGGPLAVRVTSPGVGLSGSHASRSSPLRHLSAGMARAISSSPSFFIGDFSDDSAALQPFSEQVASLHDRELSDVPATILDKARHPSGRTPKATSQGRGQFGSVGKPHVGQAPGTSTVLSVASRIAAFSLEPETGDTHNRTIQTALENLAFIKKMSTTGWVPQESHHSTVTAALDSPLYTASARPSTISSASSIPSTASVIAAGFRRTGSDGFPSAASLGPVADASARTHPTKPLGASATLPSARAGTAASDGKVGSLANTSRAKRSLASMPSSESLGAALAALSGAQGASTMLATSAHLSALSGSRADFFAAATALSELAKVSQTRNAQAEEESDVPGLSAAVNEALELVSNLARDSTTGNSGVAETLALAQAHLSAAAAVLCADAPELDLPAGPSDYGTGYSHSQSIGASRAQSAASGIKRTRKEMPKEDAADADSNVRRSERARVRVNVATDLEDAYAGIEPAPKPKRIRKTGLADRKVHGEGHAALHHAKNPWTEREDALLRDAYVRVTAESTKDVVPWHKIAELVPSRTGKQCRERWIHHLRPHVDKSDWTPQEDQIIFNQLSSVGKRWATIAQALDGRTAQQVKNRYYASMRRLARQKLREEAAAGLSPFGRAPAGDHDADDAARSGESDFESFHDNLSTDE